MTVNGQVVARIEPDGSAMEIPETNRHEWVCFPLAVGSGWTFEVLSRSRGVGESMRYEHQCATTKWEEIEAIGRNVRALRIECQSWVWSVRP
jgi:hypothetical protein